MKNIILKLLIVLLLTIFSNSNNHSMVREIDMNENRNDFINSLKSGENKLKFLKDDYQNDCKKRDDLFKGPPFFKFLPTLKAILRKEGDTVNFKNACFNSNLITILKLTTEETVLKLTSYSPDSLFCKDSYIISTSNIHDIEVKFFSGDDIIKLKNLSEDDILEIQVNGIRVFSFCEDLTDNIYSIYKTMKLFLEGFGESINFFPDFSPEENEKANIEFLKYYANYTITSRDEYKNVILPVDENLVQSGDFIPVYKISGLGSMIMYLTGSHITHSTIAFRIDDELYILESEERGILKTKYNEWIKLKYEHGYNVGWLPLKDEYRKKFDYNKALEWFKKVEGLNYGYNNFIFHWFDVSSGNTPDFVQSEVFLLIFSIIDKFDNSLTKKFLIEALNLRLNTKDFNISRLSAEAVRRGISFEELMAMPEQDEWIYNDGENYVCSSFVIAIYKAAGIFNGYNINSKEFTPRDIYQLNIFDKEYKDRRPDICKKADPELDYCQIIGKYKLSLNNYSTISPYSGMNEKCPTIPPFYFRPNDC